MLEVSVVIPNYNGEEFLTNCLNSIRKQNFRNFETIVVDNGSTDGSLEILKSDFTEVRLIELEENTGFCHAVNVGIKASKAPFVILLNNDTEVAANFVEEMLKGIKRYRTAFSCGAKMCNYYYRHVVDNVGNFYSAMGWAFARGEGKHEALYNKSRLVFATCGGAAIYKKSVFEEIGYFDERHFAYLEDIDICYRAKIHGYTNRYLPDAVVYHVGSGTTGSKHNEFKVNLSAKNNVYTVYKNMPIVQIIINLPFILVGHVIKMAYFARKGLLKAYVRGLLEGLACCASSNCKVKYERSHLKNYIGIQFELWGNIIKRISN